MTLRSRERSVVKDDLPAGERMVAMRKSKRKIHWSDAGDSDPQVLVLDGCSGQDSANKKSALLPTRTPATPAAQAGVLLAVAAWLSRLRQRNRQ